MPALLGAGLVVALLGYILYARIDRSLVAFLGLIVLVPGAFLLPNALTSLLTIHRLAVIALGLRLLIAVRRNELSKDVLRPTPVHAAFYAFLLIALVNGVLMATPATSTTKAVRDWLGVLDQFIAFAVVLGIVRSLRDTRFLARSLAILVGASAFIALLERYTGASYARFILAGQPGLSETLGAIELEQRGGGARVRAAAGFALQFAWMSAMALPIAAAVAVRAKRWSLRLVPALVVLTIYWSNSRSALVGIVVVVAIVALLARDRRATRIGVAALVVGGLLWAVTPSLRAPFSGERQEASTELREDRLDRVAEILTTRPYTGLGFGGLVPFGLPTTDASYLVKYAALGVIGLAAFVVLLIVLLVSCSASLRGPPSWDRLLGTAAFAGVVAGLVGGGSFDLFELSGSANLFWIVAAIAVGMAERNAAPRPSVMPSRARFAIAPIAVGLGLAASVVVPSHAAVVTPFDSIPLSHVVAARGSERYIGGFWRDTACGSARAVALSRDVSLDCYERSLTPGFGRLRVEAPTLAEAERATASVTSVLRTEVTGIRFHEAARTSGRPTWARTAPAWLGTAGVLLALFCPLPRRRRAPTGPHRTERAAAQA